VAGFLDGIEACREFPPRYQPRPADRYQARPAGWWKSEGITYPETGRSKAQEEKPSLDEDFNRLAKKWREETAGFSVTAQKYAHPAYHAILVLGAMHVHEVVPLILEELRARPGRWFEVLKLLTNEDPTKPEDSFDDAVRAWVAWGIRNKHIR